MGRFNRALKLMEVLGFIKTSMKAEDTIVDSTATVSPGWKNSLMGCLPLAVFVGWWVYSLQFQWRAQEEYRFGYLVVVLVAYFQIGTVLLLSARAVMVELEQYHLLQEHLFNTLVVEAVLLMFLEELQVE